MMGGAAGAGGTGAGGGSANVYLPQAQPAADQALQSTILPLLGLSANAGAGTPAAQNYPAARDAVYGDILNPGFQNQAIAGSQAAADSAFGTVAPQAFDSANWLRNIGAIGLANAQTPMNFGFDPRYSQAITDIQNNPYYGTALQGATDAAAMGRTGANAIQGLAGQVAGQIPQLQGLAGQMGGVVNPLLQSGFDPRSALFNRTEGRLMDQTNAINAMSGLGGTPYGASVSANALGNFDIDWQNQQLARQAQAAGAAGQAAGTAGNLYGQAANQAGQAGNLYGAAPGLMATTAGLPSNVYTGQIGQILQALQARNQGANQGITGFGSLLGSGQNAMTGANALNLSGTGAQQQFGSAPYNTASGIGANSLTGLSNLTNLGNNAFQLPQQEIGNLMQYMGLGQNASNLSGSLGNLGFNQTAQGIGGGLSAANMLLGPNSLLGGKSGLFGSGGLGGLFGAGASVPLDIAGVAQDAAGLGAATGLDAGTLAMIGLI
jgi:hypothetical protein